MYDPATIMAGRGKRLGGALLDGLINLVIIVPIMLLTGYLQQSFSGDTPSFGQQMSYGLLSFLIFLILHGYLLYSRGQTIGKLIVNTKIVDKEGNILNFGKLIVLRYLVIGLISMIPILGPFAGIADILFIFRKDRRCIHDHLAGTWVVDKRLIGNEGAGPIGQPQQQ